MASSTYTDEQKAEALDLYAVEGPTAVQHQLGIPKGTVTRWAKAAGVETVPDPKNAAAVEAARKKWAETMEQRKQDLAAGLMDDIAQLREQMFSPCREQKIVTIAGSVKTEGRWDVAQMERDQPTFQDQKALMTTIAIAVDKVQVLTGGATQRTEHRYESGVDAEIRELTEALSSNDA